MGYTHYYEVRDWNAAKWQKAWPKLIQDVALILEAADVLTCGPFDENEERQPPTVKVEKGIWINGVADDGHEPFCLGQQFDRWSHEFVKTLQKPYDLAVACVLLRAYSLAPDGFKLGSDGSWNQLEWVRARRLYEELWPGEPIRCPWGEADDDRINDGDAIDEETEDAAEETDEESDNIISNEGETPILTAEITDAFKRFQLDSRSSSQHKTEDSAILGVDLSFTRHWLSSCEEDIAHSERNAPLIQWQNLPSITVKVVDVHRRCIVELPERSSFIALTYVWGGVGQPRLNATTTPLLKRDGALDILWQKISTTIRDAIIVCQRLGERYLWVDALCIMEDSVRDLRIQILRMRQI